MLTYTNILKIHENTHPGKKKNRKIDKKCFPLDSGTSRHAYGHTKNLGKYTFWKVIIFKMASKMVSGRLIKNLENIHSDDTKFIT